MFIDFLKHMRDIGINSGLHSLENSFGKLVEDKVVVRIVYTEGVCHGPVPVVNKKLSIRIDTYLLIGSGLSSIYSLYGYIITYVVIFDIFHLDVTES